MRHQHSKIHLSFFNFKFQPALILASLLTLSVASFADDAPDQVFGGYNAAAKKIMIPSIPSASQTASASPAANVNQPFQLQGIDLQLAQQIIAGMRLSAAGNPAKAIEDYDAVIAHYEQKYTDTNVQIYCARDLVEALFYSGLAAKNHKDAKVLSANWAYAYYLKAYALVDLGRGEEAKPLLDHALALSPQNAQFLDELGNYYERHKDWDSALATYQKAEEAANSNISPSVAKNSELATAWRGQGFVYTETHRLDEAEKMYHKCLELNPNDIRAQNELSYIAKLKATGQTSPIQLLGANGVVTPPAQS